LRNKDGDVIGCIEKMTLGNETAVFREMIDAGLVEGTADYLVDKHSSRFAEALVAEYATAWLQTGFRYPRDLRSQLSRRPGESRDPPFSVSGADKWVPAFAGTPEIGE
jgi:hypothetical protein